MTILSVRDNPGLAKAAISYFQKRWATEESKMVYEDCILSCLPSSSPLPQWYLLYDRDAIAGCAGLITNDFISRMDLWPWLCALYVEKEYRGHAYGGLLIGRVKEDAARLGYARLYLCSGLDGYYEKYGFTKTATGYHPWGETTNIFETDLEKAR